ncbi:uncharacterized protein [Mytilus edulis]|uniref:uncharacterized protein n=1 Tax=Mytilus edulis TaxID=6550 RepID=UPI0039EEE7BA
MSEPVKKKRIRSSDLVKSARCFGESKYDFSKIIKLKGATGRDVSKKGRPEGITSTASHVQETSSTSMIVANEDAGQEDIVTFGSFDLQCQLDPENVSVLSADDVYLNLLKENCGIFCSDNGYRTFVLKEFDSKRLQLKATQFLFVSRRAMSFEGDFHWIYTCSCDVAGTELIECCGQQMEVTFAELY